MALSLRTSVSVRAARPTVTRKVAAARPVRSILVRAEPSKSAVETAIKEAEEACKDGTTGECAAAWDAVEEVSAAASDKKAAVKAAADPLEQFCEGDPSADECRVYDE
eukprot:CAMPEP_0202943328 /NCGR_PEP_ID=MMETSP1395-20130829/3741_1 /ASSEMBLY_ACC=CAM_ASM_000871 /TAXON_ID=5961 /ORGANISM="Blepharisma japonicum, Strain Stock R1072" /LENGTH=107 /DNA_ID=CAMNT_0049640667 /DNA_START=29 /DNA_END=352 /DNA_ORIENTATION=-